MKPPTAVLRLIDRARSEERNARHERARSSYEFALAGLRGPEHAATASSLIRWIGRTHHAVGDLEAALDCYEAALAIATADGAAADMAHAFNCKANVAFIRGHLDEALDFYEVARLLADEGSEPRLRAIIDQNLGNIANIRGDFKAAMERYRSSLVAYRKLGLREYLGPLLNNLGRLHTDLEEWSDAEGCFQGAVSSCRIVSDKPSEILVEVNRTRMWIARREWSDARDSCDAAHELAERLGDERWMGEIHKHHGIISRAKGNAKLAERSFQQALISAESLEDLLLQAEITREMADLYRRQERGRDMLLCLIRAQGAFAELRAGPHLADVRRQIATLEASFLRIVREWGESIESKDRYTQGHCTRVADYATRLAEVAGLDTSFVVWFRMGALLHDVGKIAVPTDILNKRGALSDDEWDVMRRHPQVGVELLGDVEFPWDIRPMIRNHHERWDGLGYPDGMAGTDIPLPARILCVADVFDALTTARSYRPALSVDAAVNVMASERSGAFDPRLLDAFLEMVPSLVAPQRLGMPTVDFWPADPPAGRRALRMERRNPWMQVA